MKQFAEDRQHYGKQQAEIVSDEVLAELSGACSLETTTYQVLTVRVHKSSLSKSPCFLMWQSPYENCLIWKRKEWGGHKKKDLS